MEGDYELVLTHGAGTLTIDQSKPYVEGDPVLTRNENRPQSVQFTLLLPDIASRNLLSSTCSLWSSGTGALEIGDRVRLSLYPTSTRTKTVVFTGLVHEFKVIGDNLVSVEAREDWAQYDTLQRDRIYFSGHRDLVYKSTAIDVKGQTVIQGLSEANIALPVAAIKLMSAEEIEEQAPGGSSLTSGPYTYHAQRFIASHSQLIGVRFSAAFNPAYPLVGFVTEIRADNNGNPGTVLRSVTLPSGDIVRSGETISYWANIMDNGAPFEISTGAHYWFVLRSYGSPDFAIVRHDSPNIPPEQQLILKASTDGTAWSTPNAGSLSLTFYSGDYEWATGTSQSLIGTDLTLYGEAKVRGLPKNVTTVPPASLTPKRAIVSYYYDKRNTKGIMEDLLAIGTCSSSVISTREVKLYRTKGKSISECLRELCDLRDASGAYAGSQLAIAQWTDSSQVLVRRRKHLGDASSFTFSYGTDTSNDNERRIIAGGVKLSKTTRLKPTKVKVLGRASGGLPLVAVVHDKATAGLSAKLGYDVEETLQDDSLQTLEDCRAYGKAYLDSVRPSYDAWEGQLSVAGVYPDLFDLNVASDTYGSGQIITLNYSPLGISGLKAKVKGIRVMGTKTELTLSSEDLLINNRFSDVAWRAARSESFVSPTDAESNVVIEAYSATPRAAPAQLGLIANQAVIPGHIIVPCTVTDDAELNLRTIHAEVEAANGSTLPTAPITHVGAYNASNGYLWDVPVAATYKWKTTRVILEITCRLS